MDGLVLSGLLLAQFHRFTASAISAKRAECIGRKESFGNVVQRCYQSALTK
jgi:hypothetical protein